MLKIRGFYRDSLYMRILLVTEDSNIAHTVSKSLEQEHILETISDPTEAIYFAEDSSFSVIVLDQNISKIPADEICFQIRQRGIGIPILLLSNDSEVVTRVSSIDRGADVSLRRDFEPIELSAQLKALLRRYSPETHLDQEYKVGDLVIDLWKRSVFLKNKLIPMKRREFSLLELFILNRNQVLTRDKILCALWKDSAKTDSNVVDVYVCNLRNTLKDLTGLDPIRTVYGLGYIFEDLNS